jgi:hypothetical protein
MLGKWGSSEVSVITSQQRFIASVLTSIDYYNGGAMDLITYGIYDTHLGPSESADYSPFSSGQQCSIHLCEGSLRGVITSQQRFIASVLTSIDYYNGGAMDLITYGISKRRANTLLPRNSALVSILSTLIKTRGRIL